MFTAVETTLFQRQWPMYWTEEERDAFATYIAQYPGAGDVVPESGGIRKLRWRRTGSGKSGGVRIIYHLTTSGLASTARTADLRFFVVSDSYA